MTVGLVLLSAIIVTAVTSRGPADAGGKGKPSPRFGAVDVYLDSGAEPLAAYQFELSAHHPDAKIVGVEGGEHAAFREAPYYDPAALQGGRIVIAAYNTGADLPTGKTRVATIHFQLTGDATPEYEAKLVIAASASGSKIHPNILVERKEGGVQ